MCLPTACQRAVAHTQGMLPGILAVLLQRTPLAIEMRTESQVVIAHIQRSFLPGQRQSEPSRRWRWGRERDGNSDPRGSGLAWKSEHLLAAAFRGWSQRRGGRRSRTGARRRPPLPGSQNKGPRWSTQLTERRSRSEDRGWDRCCPLSILWLSLLPLCLRLTATFEVASIPYIVAARPAKRIWRRKERRQLTERRSRGEDRGSGGGCRLNVPWLSLCLRLTVTFATSPIQYIIAAWPTKGIWRRRERRGASGGGSAWKVLF